MTWNCVGLVSGMSLTSSVIMWVENRLKVALVPFEPDLFRQKCRISSQPVSYCTV